MVNGGLAAYPYPVPYKLKSLFSAANYYSASINYFFDSSIYSSICLLYSCYSSYFFFSSASFFYFWMISYYCFCSYSYFVGRAMLYIGATADISSGAWMVLVEPTLSGEWEMKLLSCFWLVGLSGDWCILFDVWDDGAALDGGVSALFYCSIYFCYSVEPFATAGYPVIGANTWLGAATTGICCTGVDYGWGYPYCACYDLGILSSSACMKASLRSRFITMIAAAITALLITSDDRYFWTKEVSGKNLSGIFYRFNHKASIHTLSMMWNGL